MVTKRLKLFLTGFLCAWIYFDLVNGNSVRYDNYRFYEVKPHTEEHVKLLQDIELFSDSYIFIAGARNANISAAVIVAPHKFDEFDSMLNRENITFQIAVDNVQTLIDDEVFIQSRISEAFGWNTYYPLKNIYKWMDSILEKYPTETSPIIAGTSYKGRQLRGIKISYKRGNPGIFVEAGIHAREWISPAVATYLLNTLLSSKSKSIRRIAENFDWYIVPVTNPDGYVYSHTKNRFWRKTRKPYGKYCVGADPNRNWDFHWAEKGVNRNPCSDLYPGPHAFSEIEMRTYSQYLRSVKNKIHAFIGFHSYSQLLLFPFGHTDKHVLNFNDLMQIGVATVTELQKRYNTKYTVGHINNLIGPVSGSSMDYVYGLLSVPLTYTYELRPSDSKSGFELPANEIIPASLEVIDSIVVMLDRAKALGYFG